MVAVARAWRRLRDVDPGHGAGKQAGRI